MAAFQAVFKRCEYKYLISAHQRATIINSIKQYMKHTDFGYATVRNIYFDTDNYLLIRRSIEKPVYKEKLRIRSYSTASPDKDVFVELKKKYKSVVYKRRILLPEGEAMAWLMGEGECSANSQITNEIDYFLNFYGCVRPKVFLSYERESFCARNGSDFRVTFDDTILCRRDNLSLCGEVYGEPIIPEDSTIMEIKCSGAIPLWMTEILTREHIYKTQFSKYGTAYKNLIFKDTQFSRRYHKNA